MKHLTRKFQDKDWQAFADEFLELYANASSPTKLVLMRKLMNEWRHSEVINLIAPNLNPRP